MIKPESEPNERDASEVDEFARAEFQLAQPFSPAGDQPSAIEALTKGFNSGKSAQVLLGATGTGKTFTMANVIANVGRPTLVLSHNKTLAAQLYSCLLYTSPSPRDS